MKTLAPHQTYASGMMEILPELAIFYEAGCGKTNSALDWMYKRRLEGGGPFLIICPRAAVSVWETQIDELNEWEGYDEDGIASLKETVTVTSFGMIWRRVDRTIHIREEYQQEWDAVIIDESQALGSHSSVQTRACLGLAKHQSRRYILSGTPISGGGGKADWQKLYGQMKFLHPDLWRSWTQFCSLAVKQTNQWHKPILYDEEYCRRIMVENSIVARLEDVREMPGQIISEIPLKAEEKTILKDFKNLNTDKYGITVRTGGTVYIKILELVSGFYKDDAGKNHECRTAKDDALRTIIEGTDDKIVVFCRFSQSVNRAAEICAKYGMTIIYDGSSDGDVWKDFQYGDARYIICQYQRGNQAINLQSSHTTVFYEPCLSALLLEQCMQRTYRIGQTDRCIYYWLVTRDTIEGKVQDTVRSGVDVTRDLLDKWAQENV